MEKKVLHERHLNILLNLVQEVRVKRKCKKMFKKRKKIKNDFLIFYFEGMMRKMSL